VSTYKGWVYDGHCRDYLPSNFYATFKLLDLIIQPPRPLAIIQFLCRNLFGLSPSCQSFVLTILLYIKERRSKFKLVLDNNAHCFKADFMLVHAVTETLVKACKCLYPCVECLMPGPGSTLWLALYKSICL
jgi:hypothetical protein